MFRRLLLYACTLRLPVPYFRVAYRTTFISMLNGVGGRLVCQSWQRMDLWAVSSPKLATRVSRSRREHKKNTRTKERKTDVGEKSDEGKKKRIAYRTSTEKLIGISWASGAPRKNARFISFYFFYIPFFPSTLFIFHLIGKSDHAVRFVKWYCPPILLSARLLF